MKLQILFAVIFFFSTQTRAAQTFDNPGGMWMPSQIPGHAETLRSLGLEIDPAELADPTSSILAAIVHLGFCSGSFVSEDALIITNHHCAEGLLTYLNQIDRERGITDTDHLQNGFIAQTLAEERPSNPTQRIYVTDALIDVTEEIRKDLDKIADPVARMKEVERRRKAILKRSESARPNIKSQVESFFRGEKFFLIERLEIQDIRVVYAPPSGVGFYGGDTDNWHWPRHTGDFAFIRAYVGPDGNPAPYSEKNVPYKPKRILKVAPNGLKADDLTLVAGFPGRTTRLLTGSEVVDQMERAIPVQIKLYSEMEALFKKLGENDKDAEEKTKSRIFSLANVLKKQTNALRLLKERNFVQTKREFEEELIRWINPAPGEIDPVTAVNQLNDKYLAGWEADTEVGALNQFVLLLDSAVKISRLAEERLKPDADREEAYQERNWKQLEQNETSKQRRYSRKIDVAAFKLIAKRAVALPADKRPAFVGYLLNGAPESELDQKVDALFESQLENETRRLELLKTATPEQLAASTDPLVQFGIKMAADVKKIEDETRAFNGELMLIGAPYIEQLRAFVLARNSRMLAPDANSTLRITFGQVSGYTKPNGQWQEPFSYATQLEGKHKPGDPEFEVPQKVLDKVRARDFGQYADSTGDLPLNFLANVDTTGGNSGSAALNAKGELVGLLFDGNEDTLYSDWMFDNGVRSILFDVRFALWMLEKVDHVTRLLDEMKIQ